MPTNMAQRTTVGERRKDTRKRPPSLVYVELSSSNGGMLRDLSEVGFAMRAMMPLRVGESMPFTFALDEVTRLEGRCKVLWVEEGGHVAGLQFTEVPTSLRGQIRNWLGEKEVYTPPPPAPLPAATVPLASTMEELREELRTVVARPEAPERDELPLPELHSETAEAPEETHARSFRAEESKPAELLDQLHPSPAHRAEPEAIPVLESLPSLSPLPLLDGADLFPVERVVRPSMNRAVVSLALRILVMFALIAVAVVYHHPIGNAIVWVGQTIAGDDAPEISPVRKSEIIPTTPEIAPAPVPATLEADNSPLEEKDSTKTTAIPEKAAAEVPPVVQSPSTAAARSPEPIAPVPLPTTSKITTFTPPLTGAADGGQQEYLAAQDILKNQNAETGLAEAVRLLWVAVEKGNSNAEVALAELYRRGRGVTKNCDQTKILLTASAKKGNAEGKKHLGEFLAEGCE
jgi:hypothetical protein